MPRIILDHAQICDAVAEYLHRRDMVVTDVDDVLIEPRVDDDGDTVADEYEATVKIILPGSREEVA